ncbi:aminopeptidase P N-terminal domain-containing protein [Bacteroidota bacterium]
MRKIFFIAFVCIISSVTIAGIFDNSEYASRRRKLMEKIHDGIAIIRGAQQSGSYMEYYQNNDFIYLTGVELPNAVLIIDGKKKESTIFFTSSVRAARNEGIPVELINNPVLYTGIENYKRYENLSASLKEYSSRDYIFYTSFKPEELMRVCSNEMLGSFQRNITDNEWDGRLTRELQFVEVLKKKYPGVNIKDCSQKIWELRVIKSQAEIAILRKAGRIGVKAHTEMIKSTRPGMYEYELAALYEYYCKKEGAQDLAYYAIICSGPNHPYYHYYKHDRLLKDGEFLVIDVGPDYAYYDIDITVSYPVSGKFTPRQKEIYEACNAVHEANMKVYRPGLTSKQCRMEVAEILKKQGFDLTKDYFQRMQGGFGHYVGMSVHDVGGGPSVLKAGMVIANEPLISYPDEELGFRVEDTILITEDGCENLTAGIPRTVEEIETIMKQVGVIQTLQKNKLY